MRILADECCESGLVAALRQAGHDVRYVAETRSGSTDDEVLATAARENRILLTDDKDFGELVVRFGRPVAGIVLLRIEPGQAQQRRERLLALIENFGGRLPGHYTVVHLDRYRFRPLRD